MEVIPQIIHQTGPADPDLWNSIWYMGRDAWKRLYPRFEHRLWNDDEIDSFMEEFYPYYYESYRSLHMHIQQIDVSRLFILHKYGGIYSDLDYIPHKNFYRRLTNNFNIVEALSSKEYVQNCLMASPPGNPDILFLIDRLFEDYNNTFKVPPAGSGEANRLYNEYVLNTFGPGAIGKYVPLMDHTILPTTQFNYFSDLTPTDDTCGTHYLTGVWGKTTLGLFKSKEEFIDRHIEWYRSLRDNGHTLKY